MVAFLDGPIDLVILGGILLLIFGPEKMKELGGQFGKVMREVRKARDDFRISMDQHVNDDSDTHQNSYNNYNTNYNDNLAESSNYEYNSSSSDYRDESYYSSEKNGTSDNAEPVRGDFSASAFSDDANLDGTSPKPPTEVVETTKPLYTPAENTVPRDKEFRN